MSDDHREPLSHSVIPTLTFGLGVMVLVAPLLEGGDQGRIGVLLLLAALLELTHGFRRLHSSDQRSAWKSGIVSIALGFVLINAIWLAVTAFRWSLAAWFAVDGFRELAAWRETKRKLERNGSSLILSCVWLAVCVSILWMNDG